MVALSSVWLVCHCILVADTILQGEPVHFPQARVTLQRLWGVFLLIGASVTLLTALVMFYLYLAPKFANPENQKALFFLLFGISIPFVFFFSRFVYIVPLVLLQRLPLLEIYSHSLDLTASVNGLKGALVYLGLGGYILAFCTLHYMIAASQMQAYSTLFDCALLMFFVPYTSGLLLLSLEDLELRNRLSEDGTVSDK